MSNIQTIILDYDHLIENPAEAGTAAWIAANGGTDVTYRLPDHDDYSEWVGDWQASGGEVYRLLVNAMTDEISAYELEVRFDFGEETVHGGEHIWSGKEWLQETRDEDAIRSDILADLPDDIDGEFVTVIGESI